MKMGIFGLRGKGGLEVEKREKNRDCEAARSRLDLFGTGNAFDCDYELLADYSGSIYFF